MTKRFFSAALAAVLLLGLSACQSKNEPVPQPEQPLKLPAGAEPFSKGPSGPPGVRGPTYPPGYSGPAEDGTTQADAGDTQAVTETEEITFSLPADNQ